MPKIYIASDHGGFSLKNKIIDYFTNLGYSFEDLGTYSTDSCDYPVYAEKLAKKVIETSGKGILVCGTGIGMSIAANKFKGIRAALCSDVYAAKMTREHNDSNVLCLGERNTDENLAYEIVKTWLETDFSNEQRHINRINMIKNFEK